MPPISADSPTLIRKRSGLLEPFAVDKIARAIFQAAIAVGGDDFEQAQALSHEVLSLWITQYGSETPEVEAIQDLVERVLIKHGHARTAKAFILYREKRSQARNRNALAGATLELFSEYLTDRDWRVQENANAQKSINGLNNYVREAFTCYYWLHKIYPTEVAQAHESGDIHLHDLGFLGPYCSGWDLQQLLFEGFGGVPHKVESRPPRHLRTFLGQIVNSTFTTQGECAGAQAWSSFDTYCAPFIRKDGLTFEQVKQSLQEFVFNINVPTRVGFQCPFSNLTFDITVPAALRDQAVIIGGELQDSAYGDYQAEMDLFNRAFCDVMREGDAKGRVFTFPIPTLNVTRDFPWDSPAVVEFMRITCKYGIPYFANYINSDLSPEDAVSMCCRLRLNTKELKKRGGGLFGSNPLTGSIGVVTINLPRIGYLAETEAGFYNRLDHLLEISRTSLEIKRKEIERLTDTGLYPYSAHYLRHIKARTGQYWHNHFSTVGIIGMNEALLNLFGCDITTPEGQQLSREVLVFIRERLARFQEETGNVYNLEATPAEGASHSLARKDKSRYPDILTAGGEVPYYTNSTQLPVGFTDDFFEAVELQDELQSLYTGGTVLHGYMGERIDEPALCAEVIRTTFEHFKLPYLSITPTFSICHNHGYLPGETPRCPSCGRPTEVYSRVVGYLRPVQNFHAGKKAEWADRTMYAAPTTGL